MTDKEWLKSELYRTGINQRALSQKSNTTYYKIYRVLCGDIPEFDPMTRKRIEFIFSITPTMYRIDYNALGKRIAATGLTASQIRTHADVSRESVLRVMSGRKISPEVYDRLTAWLDASAPLKPPNPPRVINETKSPSLRGNIARTLDIIEGRAGVAPESSMGEGYTTSSTLPTYKHYDMPARNRANKYIQRIDG